MVSQHSRVFWKFCGGELPKNVNQDRIARVLDYLNFGSGKSTYPTVLQQETMASLPNGPPLDEDDGNEL